MSLGFESGNETMLSDMNKKFSIEEIIKTSRFLKDYDIHQMGFLLLGGSGETRSSVKESLAFADSLPLDRLKITTGIRIYPDTMLSKLAVREGSIKADDDLLHPRFYLAKGLEGWLQETVDEWMRERPHWSR